MIRFLSVFVFLFVSLSLYAAPQFTPSIDGFKDASWGVVADAGSPLYGALTSNGNYHSQNAMQDVYVTDDPTNLYIGYFYNGDAWANGGNASARIMLGIVTNPAGNSGGGADPWETGTTFGAANRPDFFLRQWTEGPYDERMEFGPALGASSATKGVAEFLKWDSAHSQWVGAGSIIHYERLTTNSAAISNWAPHTITVDTANDFSNSTEAIAASDSKGLEFTWDGSKLYFGFTNQDLQANYQAFYVAISTNTNDGAVSLPTALYLEGTNTDLAVKSQFLFFHVRSNSASVFYEDSWNGSSWNARADASAVMAAAVSATYSEFSISRSAIGNPSGKIYLMAYCKDLANGTPGFGWLYGACPNNSAIGGGGSAPKTLSKWIEVDLSQFSAPNDGSHIQPGGSGTWMANNWGEIAIPLSTLGLKTGNSVKLFMYYRPDMSKAGYSDSTPWDPNSSADGATSTTMNSNFGYTVRSDNVAPSIIGNTPAQNSTNDRRLDIGFTASDNMPFSGSDIEVTINGNAALVSGVFQTNFGYNGFIVTNNTTNYTVNLTNLPFLFEQQVNVLLSVRDASGNTTVKSYPFMVRSDTNAPVFFGCVPADAASGVSRTSPFLLSVGDDNQVDPLSLVATVNGDIAYSNGDFQPGYDGAGSQLLAYPVSNGYTLQIAPSSPFAWRQTQVVSNFASDTKGNTSLFVRGFSVIADNAAPSITNASPENGSLAVQRNTAISFLAQDDTAALSNLLTLRILATNTVLSASNGVAAVQNGEVQPGFTGSVTASGNGYDVSITNVGAFGYGQTVNVWATFSDTTTNTVTSSWFFIVKSDDVPPTLSVISPTNHQAGLSRTAPVKFFLDDDTGLALATLGVRVNGADAVRSNAQQAGWQYSAVVSNKGYEVTLVPQSPYAYDQDVSVYITAEDGSQNPVSGSWSFTVKADDVSPWLTNALPAAVSGVNIASNLQFTVADDSAVDGSTLVVQLNGAAVLSGGVFAAGYDGPLSRMSASGGVISVVIDPLSNFTYRSVNTLSVTASDLRTNALSTNWTFTVQPDDVPPYFTNRVPADVFTPVSKSPTVSFDIGDNTAVALSNTVIRMITNSVTNLAFSNGAFLPAFTGTAVTNALKGYRFTVHPTNEFGFGQFIDWTVSVSDAESNTALMTGWTIQVQSGDAEAPKLFRQKPAHGQEEVEPDATISFETSDNGGISSNGITVLIFNPDGSTNLALSNGTFIAPFNSAQSRITQNANLGFDVTLKSFNQFQFSTNYGVKVIVVDMGNNTNTNTGMLIFSIRGPDVTPPAIEQFVPRDQSSDIPVSANLSFLVADNYGVQSNAITVKVNGTNVLSNGVFAEGYRGAASTLTANDRKGWTVIIDPVSDFEYGKTATVQVTVQDTSTNAVSSTVRFSLQEQDTARAVTSFIDPARGSSAVKIKVNRSGNAGVTVYNIRGEKVKVIASRYYNIGDFVVWDGTLLDTGRKVGSGFYFIQIQGSGMNGLVKVSIVQ